MEDVVLRELETLAKERKEDVTSFIANAVKIGMDKIIEKDGDVYQIRGDKRWR
jgi:hypothetical protein